MNWRILSAIACALLLSACTHTSEIGYERGNMRPGMMFRLTEGNEVVVTFRDSTSRVGIIRPMSPDTLSLLERDSATAIELPIECIKEIRMDGNALGLLGGVLGGGSLGALMGKEMGKPRAGSWMNLSGVLAFYGGIIGATLGAVIGAEAAAAEEFCFPQKRLRPEDPVKHEINETTHGDTLIITPDEIRAGGPTYFIGRIGDREYPFAKAEATYSWGRTARGIEARVRGTRAMFIRLGVLSPR